MVRGPRKGLVRDTGGLELRDIGIDVKKPEGEWDGNDNCPFFGSLRVRGQIISGVVSSKGMRDTVVVERQTTRYMKKFERYEKLSLIHI